MWFPVLFYSKTRWARLSERASERMLLWMMGQRPYSSLLITSLHECGFKDSPAAQFDQIRALRPRFSSWTGTHRGVNDRTMRALMHRKTSGTALRKTDSLAHVRAFWVSGVYSDLKCSVDIAFLIFLTNNLCKCWMYSIHTLLEDLIETAKEGRGLVTPILT